MKRLFIFIMGVMMAVVATSRTFDMKQLGADAKGIKPCTKLINQTIEKAASEGGGTIYFPAGTYLTATIHMKSNITLHLESGAIVRFSDRFEDYLPFVTARWEGTVMQTLSPLIYAHSADNLTITGRGTLDGNGLKWWLWEFETRKVIKENGGKLPSLDKLQQMWVDANKDLEISDYYKPSLERKMFRPPFIQFYECTNILIENVKIINSPFWTTHIYKCNNVKLLGLYIFSPAAPVKAPSTDAIDIDVCNNVLVKNCYLSVNDDAIALKGGKGPWADKDSNNGSNTNIIIENCTYGFCHSALTCGSESIHNRNIILRRCTINQASRLLWLKMRADTPQNYEYILVEDIKGNAKSFLYIKPWTQFFDLKDRKDIPMSYSDHVTMRNIDFECDVFFNVSASEQYKLTNFKFENLNIKAKDGEYDKSIIPSSEWNNVKVNQ